MNRAPPPPAPRVIAPDVEKAKRIMAWLDEQPREFRELVHRVGLNRACNITGNLPPKEVVLGK